MQNFGSLAGLEVAGKFVVVGWGVEEPGIKRIFPKSCTNFLSD